MSEQIQPTPSSHSAAAALAPPEATPGVAHESTDFNFRLIVSVGVGLAVVGMLIHVAVWGLLKEYEVHNAPPAENASELAMADALRPLPKRLIEMPPPHLEGIERENSRLILGVDGAEQRFYVAPDVKVYIEKKETELFELREGQTVSITYYWPGGVAGGLGIITSIVSPPTDSDTRNDSVEPRATQTRRGTVFKIEPHNPAAARAWARAQMRRYEWVDRKKEIARIPISVAMDEVLQSKEFRQASKKNKGRGGKR